MLTDPQSYRKIGVGKMAFDKWIKGLTSDERLRHAESSLKGTIEVAHFLLTLHETNKIVVMSDTISKQVRPSYAANTYNNFSRAMLEIELVKLCSLWDPPEQDAFTIPTVVSLISSPGVIHRMAEDSASSWKSLHEDPVYSGTTDAGEIEFIKEMLDKSVISESNIKYEKTVFRSHRAIRMADAVSNSNRLTKIKNFRNKHIAHATALTRAERKIGPIPPPKVGDGKGILRTTLRVLKRLELCVKGSDFDWKGSEQIARRNAEALWHGVKIDVLR